MFVFRTFGLRFDHIHDGILLIVDGGNGCVDLLLDLLCIQSANTDLLGNSGLGFLRRILNARDREHNNGLTVDVAVPCTEAQEAVIHAAGGIGGDGKYRMAFLAGALIELERIGAVALDLVEFIIGVSGRDADLVSNDGNSFSFPPDVETVS